MPDIIEMLIPKTSRSAQKQHSLIGENIVFIETPYSEVVVYVHALDFFVVDNCRCVKSRLFLSSKTYMTEISPTFFVSTLSALDCHQYKLS